MFFFTPKRVSARFHHRGVCTQTFSRTDTFTHWRFLLHTDVCTHASFYTHARSDTHKCAVWILVSEMAAPILKFQKDCWCQESLGPNAFKKNVCAFFFLKKKAKHDGLKIIVFQLESFLGCSVAEVQRNSVMRILASHTLEIENYFFSPIYYHFSYP